MKGLVIRTPWIDMILAGTKTWEMRSRLTHTRGRIALIRAGSGLILGTAELVGCRPALNLAQLRQTQNFHGIPDDQIDSAFLAGWTTPWVLSKVELLPIPKPYRHPSGAVTWVDLPDEGLHQSLPAPVPVPAPAPAPKAVPVATLTPAVITVEPAPAVSAVKSEPLSPATPTIAWVDIPITEANLAYHHFYLSTACALLPADSIGGKNGQELGRAIRVRFEPGRVLDSDIAGDKMILRSRAETRDFFERSGAVAGDCVRFSRIGDRDFVVSLQRAAAPMPA